MNSSYTFLTLVLIWSTTPLAIQWSNEGPGPLLAVTLRMIIGALICASLMVITRERLLWNRHSMAAYASGTLSIFGTMGCVYWGAQYIPSGLISVIFGLTPLFTVFLSRLVLNDKPVGFHHIGGILIALAGLWLIFETDLSGYPYWQEGVLATLAATILYAISSVMTKRYFTDMPVLSITTGGLIVSSVLFVTCWLVIGAPLPASFPVKSISSIVYLGTIATGIGFVVYFHAIKTCGPSTTTLVTLITPVVALMLGATLNDEPLNARIIVGSLLALSGLAVTQYKTLLTLVVDRSKS